MKPNLSAATTVVQQKTKTVQSAPQPLPPTNNTRKKVLSEENPNTLKEDETTCRLISDEVMNDPRVHIEDIPRVHTPLPITFVDPLGGGLLSLTSQHLGQACPWLKEIGLT